MPLQSLQAPWLSPYALILPLLPDHILLLTQCEQKSLAEVKNRRQKTWPAKKQFAKHLRRSPSGWWQSKHHDDFTKKRILSVKWQKNNLCPGLWFKRKAFNWPQQKLIKSFTPRHADTWKWNHSSKAKIPNEHKLFLCIEYCGKLNSETFALHIEKA